jgi:hypothetical protein
VGENARHNRLASQGGCFVILHSYMYVPIAHLRHRLPTDQHASGCGPMEAPRLLAMPCFVVLVAIAATDSVPMFAPLVVPFKLERVRLAEGSLFEQKQCEL